MYAMSLLFELKNLVSTYTHSIAVFMLMGKIHKLMRDMFAVKGYEKEIRFICT